MKMKNEQLLDVMEPHFTVHEDTDYIELETWTDGGVNMFVTINKEKTDSYLKQFIDYVEGFDIDYEIDVHREDASYKSHFTIRQSVEDFEAYVERLKSIVSQLQQS